MRLLHYVLILLVLLAGVSFSMLNPGQITINYWLSTKTLPVPLFSVMIFVLGFFIGLLLTAGLFLGARMESWRLRRKLGLAEKEIQNLRTLPVQDRA